MGPVVPLALPFTAAKKLAQKSNKPSSAEAGVHTMTAVSFDRHIQNMTLALSTMVNTVTTNPATGTPILHVEASFNSVERGLRRGISSRTSLKHCIHFGFILKLAIFIYKQLKRPAAFSAVHFDVKPQNVVLQNNFFILTSFDPESFCVQRLWSKQEACASIGPRTNDCAQKGRSCSSRPIQ